MANNPGGGAQCQVTAPNVAAAVNAVDLKKSDIGHMHTFDDIAGVLTPEQGGTGGDASALVQPYVVAHADQIDIPASTNGNQTTAQLFPIEYEQHGDGFYFDEYGVLRVKENGLYVFRLAVNKNGSSKSFTATTPTLQISNTSIGGKTHAVTYGKATGGTGGYTTEDVSVNSGETIIYLGANQNVSIYIYQNYASWGATVADSSFDYLLRRVTKF